MINGPNDYCYVQALMTHFKDAIPGHKISVSFVKESISVLIPDGGIEENGWRITCTTSKVVSIAINHSCNPPSVNSLIAVLQD